MHDVVRLSDRRYWPPAQDQWLAGYAATSTIEGADHRREWRHSMRRLAARLDTTIEIRTDRAVMTAVANDGYPLDIRTEQQRDQWDQLASAAE